MNPQYETHARAAYSHLATLFGGSLDKLPEAAKSERPNYMPLCFDQQFKDEAGTTVALAHYFYQNGDACPDPDMTMRIDVAAKMVHPLSYQDSMRYQEVDETDASNPRTIKLRMSLAAFLAQWLSNTIAQGHLLAPKATAVVFDQLASDRREQARRNFKDAASGDGYLYQLDAEGYPFGRVRVGE